MLEEGDLDATSMAAVVAAYVGLRDGTANPDDVAAIVGGYAPDGTFPGHLHQGSRELDKVAGRLTHAAEQTA